MKTNYLPAITLGCAAVLMGYQIVNGNFKSWAVIPLTGCLLKVSGDFLRNETIYYLGISTLVGSLVILPGSLAHRLIAIDSKNIIENAVAWLVNAVVTLKFIPLMMEQLIGLWSRGHLGVFHRS